MSVKLKVVKRVKPQDLLAPQKYYAKAVGDGSTDLKRLAKMIVMQCTVNRADCLAVLPHCKTTLYWNFKADVSFTREILEPSSWE